ncbi:sigma 54-interacting transcriptional regulator [Paraliomyxa miuraensis]|uniref:sigma 54-interacting transcriptional regulator n=1 Tax=Paraliomyxa miuraensis TaxID=376150 RepID=UPI0022528A5E|nr:sigma 54-interacting transcriptional regulator [Paraliomyxa miuraensis]MCX4246836.1 sigma 54-interacting transcriptional regulator [Paraliomyxa miuraensis]
MSYDLQDIAESEERVIRPKGQPSLVVVIIASDDTTRQSLSAELEGTSIEACFVPDPADAIDEIDALQPNFVIVDGACVGEDRELLASIFTAARSALRVLLLPIPSGTWVSIAHACDADAILPQPLQRAALRRLLGNHRPLLAARDEPLVLPALLDRSERMREVWRLVALASCSDASVVINGETGVGKELVARALHRFSPRRRGPFVAVNCAAIPEALLESELFGHEKGAFTGATSQRKGRFELADGGTLFLDEVGDLPLALQAKLLRVLQERRFERLGGTRTLSVDVRVLSATHRQLEDEVLRGRFRADLFYRIRVLSIRVAPLQLRREDILPLWDHFLQMGASREGRPAPRTSVTARRRLLRHRWPGNVRELQNAAQHALMLVGERSIQPADLPELQRESRETNGSGSLVGLTLKQLERNAILETYAAMGTVRATAEVLGVSERKLHYRLKQYRRERSTTARLQMATIGARSEESASEEGTEHRAQILLAEDDDELRWSLHDFLECSGYRVVAVRDGRALLEHLGAKVLFERQGAPPDAIITDVRMPFLSGLDLLQKVRERGWKTPVVLMSAFGDKELKQRATALGAVAFLDKPIDTDALLHVLRTASVG